MKYLSKHREEKFKISRSTAKEILFKYLSNVFAKRECGVETGWGAVFSSCLGLFYYQVVKSVWNTGAEEKTAWHGFFHCAFFL